MSNRYVFILGIAISLLFSQCSRRSVISNTSSGQPTSRHTSSNSLRQNLVDFAKKQQGVDYNYGGRSPRSGFDCSGLIYYVYDEFDIKLTPVSRIQETEGRKIALKDVQTGDLVFFRKSKMGTVFHVALVISNNADGISVVHSTTSRGVIVENISKSSYWRPKISSARTFLPR